MSKPSFSEVLANKGFSYLWFNQILMQLALHSLNFTLIIWVFKLTNSNFAVSALVLAVYLPALFLGIFAGVFADIVDKKKVIVFVDLAMALAILSFTVIKNSYGLILLDTFIINSLNQILIPAEGSSIPQLLPKRLLFLANSMFSLTLYGAFMLGYTLAGPVVDLFGLDAIFYWGAGVLFLGSLISRNLPALKNNTVVRVKNNVVSLTVSETKKTLGFLRGKLNILVAIGLLSGVQMGIGVLAVMISAYMERVLRIQATNASLVLMLPLGLGMVIGAIILGRLFHGVPRRYIVRPAIILVGILIFIVGFAPDVSPLFGNLHLPGHHIYHLRYFLNAPSLSSTFALVAFLLGACAVAVIIPSQTVLQENTPDEIRGKIFAVLSLMMNAVSVIPIVLAGWLADIFGEKTVFMGMGVIVFLIGIIAFRPALFFAEHTLPYNVREFLGLGHWEKS